MSLHWDRVAYLLAGYALGALAVALVFAFAYLCRLHLIRAKHQS